MITIQSISAAIRRSLALQYRAQSEEQKFLAKKRAEKQRIEREWLAEKARREVWERDEDGSRARAKADREEARKQKHLDSMSEALLRGMEKLNRM